MLTQFVERGKKCPSCVMLRGPEAISTAKMALAGLDAKELGERIAVAVESVYMHRDHEGDCQCTDCAVWDAVQEWRKKNPKAPATGGTAS